MSKFLKFIVHFVVICTIICALGLVLPPFFGINTVTIDDASAETNLPMGSVTYAIPVKAEDVYVGDPILVMDEGNTYRYNVASLNLENMTGTVLGNNGESINVSIQEYMPKIVITLNYLGYLQVATQSTEGLIVLGLVVLFLIILYVIAELWRKDSSESDEEDLDDEEINVKSPKELKREEKERQKLMKEEERQIRDEERSKKKKKKAEKKTIRTGGFVDEIEDEDEDDEDEEPLKPVQMQSAASEAHELLKKEIAAATAEEPTPLPKEDERRYDTKALTEELKAVRAAASARTARREVDPADVKRRAVPSWSASQLADMAKAEGDSPEVIKDDITGVTLFDYSDILADLGSMDDEE